MTCAETFGHNVLADTMAFALKVGLILSQKFSAKFGPLPFCMAISTRE